MVEMIISTIYDSLLSQLGDMPNTTTAELKMSVVRDTASLRAEYILFLSETQSGEIVWSKHTDDYINLLGSGVAAEISMVMHANPAIG